MVADSHSIKASPPRRRGYGDSKNKSLPETCQTPACAGVTALLTIDRDAIAHNYRIIRQKLSPKTSIASVVKTDSYGLGMEHIHAVLEQEGCGLYFVATPDEAMALRRLTAHPVAVLGGVFADLENDYIRHDLTPVLNSLEEIKRWQEAARQKNAALPAIVHFDTGMNRLGLDAKETETLLQEPQRLNGLDVKIVMSHFACADEKSHPKTTEQQRLFSRIAAHFPKAKKSLASSSGIFRSPDYHHDIVRPGMALYGLNPTPETGNPMRPVVTLETRILQVRNARKDETVGYGATHQFDKDTVLATIALGYGDGIFRSLGNRGTFYYKGSPCPVVGRISMDLVTVDMGKNNPQPGEMIEIIGPHQSVDQLATAAETIGYEILTALGSRYRRLYTGGPSSP